jgi:hypothetical protein
VGGLETQIACCVFCAEPHQLGAAQRIIIPSPFYMHQRAREQINIARAGDAAPAAAASGCTPIALKLKHYSV